MNWLYVRLHGWEWQCQNNCGSFMQLWIRHIDQFASLAPSDRVMPRSMRLCNLSRYSQLFFSGCYCPSNKYRFMRRLHCLVHSNNTLASPSHSTTDGSNKASQPSSIRGQSINLPEIIGISTAQIVKICLLGIVTNTASVEIYPTNMRRVQILWQQVMKS